MRRSVALLLAATAICGASIASCGDERLSSEESLMVAEIRVAFAHTVLDGSMYAKSLRGVDQLIALYRKKPDALYDNGDDPDLTMHDVLIDGANTLRRHQPDLAASLELAAQDR